jgi:hypothetical protein
LLGGR